MGNNILRVQHAGEPYRILFAFDPKRQAVLLLGGNKSGDLGGSVDITIHFPEKEPVCFSRVETLLSRKGAESDTEM